MKLRAMDCETTDKDPALAHIWQVATDQREWLVNPGVPISDEIRELCHIDDDMMEAIQDSPSWGAVQEEILEHLRDCDALVTQNGIRYDTRVLANEFHCNGDPGLPPVYDTRILAFEAWPNIGKHKIGEVEFSGHKLANLLLHLNLASAEEVLSSGHDATWDCKGTLNVFNALPAKWREDMPGLLAFQRRAMDLQAQDWERYGVVPEDGPKFLWFRTCRKCQKDRAALADGEGLMCVICGAMGFVHHTEKRRGQAVDDGYLDFVRGLDTCPAAFRK